jgi:glutamate carboxypeptidase
VLINADEEISSPGSRSLIPRLGAEHDIVLSCESSGSADELTMATSGSGALQLRVTGRASHAGEAPDLGRNALYELAHQILQMRDLSDPATGRKLNWTMASSGTARNVIPADAKATADVRVLRATDYDLLEQQVRERIRTQLIPDTTVEVTLERMRPPLQATEPSRRAAAAAQRIYGELDKTLGVHEPPIGGATDAAFAGLQSRAVVLEGMGLQGFNLHSNQAEYVLISSIEPRLYLLARLIMGVGDGTVPIGGR